MSDVRLFEGKVPGEGGEIKQVQRSGAGVFAAFFVSAFILASAPLHGENNGSRHSAGDAAAPAKFERDRRAILSMAGNYKVTFDFEETVGFVEGYELKKPYVAQAAENVRVVEDRGDFISLQHILVAQKGAQAFASKHWRQDWIYEPETVLVFIGGNAWEIRPVEREAARGKWAQVVYQVDGSPRYGAIAAWTHANGVSQWRSPPAWRPLPRRDATRRSDYHVIDGVNRHAITPSGWVHEQDNSKLILTGKPRLLVREIGLNTYERSNELPVALADAYWAATSDYWAAVHADWTRFAAENRSFGLTVRGEPEELYTKLLALAREVKNNDKTTGDAVGEARRLITAYTTTKIGALAERLETLSTE